jgi:hypothetical protein
VTIRKIFPDAAGQAALSASGLDGFEALWQLDAGWHEDPNQRRGGWSGVTRYVLADGSAVFIKRQENHLCRTWSHPLRGVPTFFREFENILLLKRKRVAALDSLFYGERRAGGKWQAVLVTRALDGFLSLDDWLSRHGESSARPSLPAAVAEAVANLHRHHLQHGCLYGKHVFVREIPATGNAFTVSDIRFIDLEKLRWRVSRRRLSAHDTDQLMRHTKAWTASERDIFARHYNASLTA